MSVIIETKFIYLEAAATIVHSDTTALIHSQRILPIYMQETLRWIPAEHRTVLKIIVAAVARDTDGLCIPAFIPSTGRRSAMTFM